MTIKIHLMFNKRPLCRCDNKKPTMTEVKEEVTCQRCKEKILRRINLEKKLEKEKHDADLSLREV